MNWLEKQARIKIKDAPADKKTGTEFTTLLRKKEGYFTWDGIGGWFDLDERFNAVSAYWFRSSTEWRKKGPIFVVLFQPL